MGLNPNHKEMPMLEKLSSKTIKIKKETREFGGVK